MIMTFELVRFHWPNVVAILALAAMPALALATLARPHTPAIEAFAIEDATNRPLPAEMTVALATVATSSVE